MVEQFPNEVDREEAATLLCVTLLLMDEEIFLK